MYPQGSSLANQQGPAQDMVSQQSAVENAVYRVGSCAEELNVVIGELEQRLSSVLRPVPPTPQGINKLATADPVQSALTERLQQKASHISDSIQRIRSLLANLEV